MSAVEPERPAVRTIRVGFPLYPEVTLMDFAGATQVFGFARGGGVRFQSVWLAATADPVPTTEGVSVLPSAVFRDAEAVDILFVPGGGPGGVDHIMFDAGYQRYLAASARVAGWVGAVCVGAFGLTAAGLLDGCQVTTYWSQFDNLAALGAGRGITLAPGYPRFVVDEPRRRFTGGGVSSSVDLALELVSRLAGRDAAEAAQLSVQYAPQPPVHAGDPAQAPAELVGRVRAGQAEGFINPVRRSVERFLQSRPVREPGGRG